MTGNFTLTSVTQKITQDFDSQWVKEKTNKYQTATKPHPSNIRMRNRSHQVPVENTEFKLSFKNVIK